MKSSGWLWCVLCCLCGSWVAGLLACCMEGFKWDFCNCPAVFPAVLPSWSDKFKCCVCSKKLNIFSREYRHTCPKCNAILGIYEGETTKCQVDKSMIFALQKVSISGGNSCGSYPHHHGPGCLYHICTPSEIKQSGEKIWSGILTYL